MSTHPCPISGCDNEVARDQLVCLTHWRMVPKQLGRDLYRAWRGGAGAGTAAHSAAIDACLAAVEAKIAGDRGGRGGTAGGEL